MRKRAEGQQLRPPLPTLPPSPQPVPPFPLLPSPPPPLESLEDDDPPPPAATEVVVDEVSPTNNDVTMSYVSSIPVPDIWQTDVIYKIWSQFVTIIMRCTLTT